MTRRPLLLLLAAFAAAALVTGLAVGSNGETNKKTFEYATGLWGDFPYSDTQAQTGVPNLIADMNQSDIEFSVHDGDLKAGSGVPASVTPTTCVDALYTQALGFFNSLEKPAIFTTGDNDWTDCDRPSNGGFNSLERLQHERQVFFSTDQSLGQKTLTMEVQSTPLCLGTDSPTGTPTFQTPCVENRRWTFHKVTFATLDVQGSCNNLCDTHPSTKDPGSEYYLRNTADVQWLQDTFDEAKANHSAGVMIVWQADPGFDLSGYQDAPCRNPETLRERLKNPSNGVCTGTVSPTDGFQDILKNLRELTIDFKKPVVLVHGDSHYFMVDKPLLDSHGRLVENFTRVETFGDNTFGTCPSDQPRCDNNHVHWVKALIDPQSRDVFAFQAQIVPANRTVVPAP
jgi:hypothetical protein